MPQPQEKAQHPAHAMPQVEESSSLLIGEHDAAIPVGVAGEGSGEYTEMNPAIIRNSTQ